MDSFFRFEDFSGDSLDRYRVAVFAIVGFVSAFAREFPVFVDPGEIAYFDVVIEGIFAEVVDAEKNTARAFEEV